MEGKVKNLCAPIPEELHARVREEQEASGQTLGQYMTWLIQTFYDNQNKEENNYVRKSFMFCSRRRIRTCDNLLFCGGGES